MSRLICCTICKKAILQMSKIAKIERTTHGQYYYGTCCVKKEEV